MTSSPITSCHIHEETMKDFIFLGSKITVDGDSSMKLKDLLAPWKKSNVKPRHIKKKKKKAETLLFLQRSV